MKTRIISAAVGIVILFAVLLCPYTWLFALALAAVAGIAVFELLHNTGLVKNTTLLISSVVYGACQVLAFYTHQTACWVLPLVYGLFVLLLVLARHETMTVSDGGCAFFLTLYAVLGFTALLGLRISGDNNKGIMQVLLTLAIPWMSDTGAYFTGVFFGKHKMAPVISPKKTWEGFFGGLFVSAGSAMLLMYWLQQLMPSSASLLPIWVYGLLAFLLAPLSVCGDLFASAIKRHSGIKDYGNLMPGHGGAMDRFDSVVIIAPILYMILLYVG